MAAASALSAILDHDFTTASPDAVDLISVQLPLGGVAEPEATSKPTETIIKSPTANPVGLTITMLPPFVPGAAPTDSKVAAIKLD